MQELRNQDLEQSNSLTGLHRYCTRYEPSDTSTRQALLERVIETEILPRLLIAHRERIPPLAPISCDFVGELDVSEFAGLLIGPRSQRAREYVERLGRVRSREKVLLEILAPAARRLGELWETDHCDFVEATVGLRRLHDLMRDLISDFDSDEPDAGGTGRILLLASPGETHVFGVTMAERIFRVAGWRTRLTLAAEYLDDLRREWFDIVGFSLSCERRLPTLAAAISLARTASANPSIFVLVGGKVFVDRPELSRQVGADATAQDASSAVQLAKGLLNGRGRL